MTDRFAMLPTTLAEIVAALAPGWPVAGAHAITVDEVCIDSRQARDGSLFVALPGENVDGHDYVAQAISEGARIALVERRLAGLPCVDTVERRAPEITGAAVTVRVESTLAALQALATVRRRALDRLRVIGVTGSVGKTTAKEAISSVLSTRYAVLKSGGNRNNEIGLPLTLMTARPEHQRAVLEMGMYQIGEIADLCRIAAPQAGLVTNVEPVHIERLGSIERIAAAKSELVAALPTGGWVALNADDPRVSAMASLTPATAVTFGWASEADVRVVQTESLGLEGNRFCVQLSGDRLQRQPMEYELSTAMLGSAAVRSALAGVTVGLLEGLEWDEIQQGLSNLGQGLRLTTRKGHSGVTILDDCYNASPSSVISALGLLAGLAGRRVAVLGDMLELGSVEKQGHRSVGKEAAGACDRLICVGPRARLIALAALEAGMPSGTVDAVDSNTDASALLAAELRGGEVVLVKGSRSMRMEEIVAHLVEASL